MGPLLFMANASYKTEWVHLFFVASDANKLKWTHYFYGRYCINPFNSDITGHKPSKFLKIFRSHRSLGGRLNCFQMWSQFFLPSIASCLKNPPESHVMNSLSEMSLSDIGVMGHTPVRIDHIDTVLPVSLNGPIIFYGQYLP
jgi:hypothetical protein